MSWNTEASTELDRLGVGLKAGYKFDSDLFSSYGRELGTAVRSGDEASIVCFAWYTALEAGRALVEMGIWNKDELLDVLVSKQHDYGHDNINAFGQIGIAVRLSDKIARYYNLKNRGGEAKNEPFIDCLKDMVGYGVISAMVASGGFNEPLEGDQ